MRVLFQRECFRAFFAEAYPLIQRHKAEIAHYADIPLDVDTTKYELSEKQETLRVYTARLNNGASSPLTLIGYSVFFVGPNPKYKSSIQAVEDALYVDPDQRNGRVGLDLIHYTDSELRREGVQAVYRHQKLAHPALGVLLAKEGYEQIDLIWGKRLDR